MFKSPYISDLLNICLIVSSCNKIRAIDKMEYLMINFSYFSSKPYDVTPHLNRLDETVQMRGSQYMFLCRINK